MIKSISKAIKFNVVTCGFRRETVQAGWVCCTKCSEKRCGCILFRLPLAVISHKVKMCCHTAAGGFHSKISSMRQTDPGAKSSNSCKTWKSGGVREIFFFFLKKPANVSEHLQRSGISRWNNFWWMCCVVDFTAWEKSEACLVKQSFYFIVSLRSKCG